MRYHTSSRRSAQSSYSDIRLAMSQIAYQIRRIPTSVPEQLTLHQAAALLSGCTRNEAHCIPISRIQKMIRNGFLETHTSPDGHIYVDRESIARMVGGKEQKANTNNVLTQVA